MKSLHLWALPGGGTEAASLPAASGRVLALTFFPPLIKDAFHMTARKEKKKIIHEGEVGT